MRSCTWWRMFGLATAACVAGAAGCRSAVADFYDDLAKGGTGAGGAGGTGGIPMECQGDPTKDPSLVRDECGVFVDAAAPTSGNGKKASPFKTVSEAAKTGRSIIFICAAAYTEADTVELSNGVSVYGGFAACPSDGDWTWDNAKRAVIQGPAGAPVMKISMGQNHVEGIDLVAPDAFFPGESAIALIADSAVVDLVNVHLTAGKAQSGEAGTTPSDVPAAGASADSNSPTDACVMNTITGGIGAVTVCSDGNSQGGDGGKGGTVPGNHGEPGVDGMPLPADNPAGDGLGGTVDPITGVCGDGKDGKDGDIGEPGEGGTKNGTLTISGIVGGDGGDGKPGSRGQGGGGGGGSKAGLFCGSNPVKEGAGASGGGGGAGGCGGKGGTGGKVGGSSVGIISLMSTFTFSGVLVKVSDGGDGGAGGFGVPGALGGGGATGGAKSGGTSMAGCDGGNGGYGGNGGSGGGGRGGHSVGIAFKGDAPSTDTGITIETAAPGLGGQGDPNVMNDGAPGVADAVIDFGKT